MFELKNIPVNRALYEHTGSVLAQWQARIFTQTFTALAIIGVIPFVILARQAVINGQWHFFALYTALYTVICLVALVRQAAFRLRLWAGLLVFFVFGVYTGAVSGLAASWMYLLLFSLLGVIFGRFRTGIMTLALNLAALYCIGILLPEQTALWDIFLMRFQGSFHRTGQENVFLFLITNALVVITPGLLTLAVESSGREFRRLAAITSDLVWSLTHDFKISYVSPSAYAIFGYGQKELIGCYLHDFMDPGRMDEFNTAIKKGEFVYETRILHRDRTPVDVEIYGIRTGSSHKSAHFYQGTIRDVSERKALERERDQLKAKLAQALKYQALDGLSRQVTHDLSSVLSGIATYPELLLMEEELDGVTRKGIEIIQQSGQLASDIVSDFVVISSSLRAGKQPLDLNRLISRFLASREAESIVLSGGANSGPILDLAPDLPMILGSYQHMEAALARLLWFAFYPSGKGKIPRVKIATFMIRLNAQESEETEIPAGVYVCLKILCNGQQLSRQYLDRLFSPFFTKKVMGWSGTGLELSVVWNMVQAHDGFIHAASGRDGTRIEIYFPFMQRVFDDIDGEENNEIMQAV